MKSLLVVVLLGLTLAGCAGHTGTRTTTQSTNSPAGTDVGTSFPGVNQPTTTTTATRSDNPTDEISNSRR